MGVPRCWGRLRRPTGVLPEGFGGGGVPDQIAPGGLREVQGEPHDKHRGAPGPTGRPKLMVPATSLRLQLGLFVGSALFELVRFGAWAVGTWQEELFRPALAGALGRGDLEQLGPH